MLKHGLKKLLDSRGLIEIQNSSLKCYISNIICYPCTSSRMKFVNMKMRFAA